MEELLTIKEAATLMNCSVRAVFRWIELGRIKPLRLPSGGARIRKAELVRSMEKHRWRAGGGEKKADPMMG